MRNQIKNNRNYTRRAMIFSAAKVALLSTLGVRLYHLQVSEADKFRTLSEGNRIRIQPIIPPRGKILDRNGELLAGGNPRYQVIFEPAYLSKNDDIRQIVSKISGILFIDPEGRHEILEKIAANPRKAIIIDDFISWSEVSKLEENTPDLPGIDISTAEIRYYPMSENMAHIVGYIGDPTKEDMEDEDNPLLRHPDFKIGKTGIEKTLDLKLRGEAGFKQIEVNVRGKILKELKTKNGTAGENVTLTIDSRLQKYVIDQISGKGGLQNEGGSAVIIDIKNGDILAMASVPSYDPNQFIRGVSKEYWRYLNNDPDEPFTNKCVSKHYPPGSTFKVITALAALEANVINESTEFYCPGYYELGNRKFHCWLHDGHGTLDLPHAIAKSCNVYFYNTAKLLGPERIAEMAQRLGLGNLTGIELPNEKEGLIPDPDWKRANLNESWYTGETLNMGIGQGYTLTTPLQLALQCSRIASGGRNIIPRLLKPAGTNEDNFEFEEIEGISTRSINSVLKGMSMVVNDPAGIVYYARMLDKEYAFGGKTGTAQVLSNKIFKYIPQEKEERYHALFIGFAPVHAPRYATAVVIEHGGYGSTISAPIGRDILLKIMQLRDGTDSELQENKEDQPDQTKLTEPIQ